MQLTASTMRRIRNRAAVAVAALLLLAGRTVLADGIERTPLRGPLSLITGAGSNVLVLETADGLALVDSGTADQAEALIAFLDTEYAGRPVRVVFNTHWHPEHSGGNEALAARGATIVAHRNTLLWMNTEYYVDWQQHNYRPRAPAALPTQTFFSHEPQPLRYELGGYTIEYGHLAEAHTDGDIYVRFVADDVIAVGDVLAVDAFPLFDYATGGWIGGNQGALALLLDVAGPGTQIIAGQGAPQKRAAVEAQLALLDEVGERIRLEIIKGKGVDEILAAGVMAGYEALPEPRRFVHNTYQGWWWGGRLRGAY